MPSPKNRSRICLWCERPFRLNENGAKEKYCCYEHGQLANQQKWITNRKADKNYKKKSRNKYYKLTYGISIEEKEQLLKDQNNVCKICENKEDNSKNWHVDHCHKTGKIRGILCSKCNQGLGLFKDNIELLRKAIDYLNAN